MLVRKETVIRPGRGTSTVTGQAWAWAELCPPQESGATTSAQAMVSPSFSHDSKSHRLTWAPLPPDPEPCFLCLQSLGFGAPTVTPIHRLRGEPKSVAFISNAAALDFQVSLSVSIVFKMT